MKTSHCILFALFSLCVPVLAQNVMLQSPDYAPVNSRLPEKPAWETDVTERLMLTSGAKYGDVMSRQARASRVRGGAMSWTLNISVPAARLGWPVVLEGDETRVLSGVTVDGAAGGFDRRDTGNLWFSGEGSLLLPLSPQKTGCQVSFTEADIPQAYENGFGRLRLRPATVNEVVRFNRDDNSGAVRAVNRSNIRLTLDTTLLLEDFFGSPLASQQENFVLAAGASAPVKMAKVETNTGELYKTRLWATVNGRKTCEYQTIEHGTEMVRARPVKAYLQNKWEKVFVPGPPARNPPPAGGWLASDVKIDDSNYASHFMWARQSFTVPADFPAGQRVQILLTRTINHHARVLCDDQVLGEVDGWDLPATLLLPATAVPGSTHTLYLGITDYIVAVAPTVHVPQKGPYKPGARSLIAPVDSVGALGVGVSMTPELVSVPAVHLENAVVRTIVVGGKTLSASVQVVNDSAAPLQSGLQMRVFDRGQPVLTLPTVSINVAAGATQTISLQAPFPGAKLWSLESPHLYELRTEIVSSNGGVLDTRRDRFGFREWGIQGGYFTLNGEVLKMHGGSHVYPTQYLWPTLPSPYRLFRHQGEPTTGVTGGGQTQGVIGTNTADELGYVIKASVGGMNALGADNYAWQFPQLWERAYRASAIRARPYINNASVFMYDLSNEIQFKGPGEADKFGNLYAQMRAFDPTRFVTNGGSTPMVTGAEVIDYHGWGDWGNRTGYWFYHPEERPSYLKNGGYFQHKPAGEPSPPWTLDLKNGGGGLQLYPGYAKDLRHIGNHAVLFSEGFYMEDIDTFPLFGDDTFLGLPVASDKKQNEAEGAWRDLNITGGRRIAIQNARQAGFASGMIHVNGGTGRYMLPLASFSWDRKFRFNSGGRMQTRFGVHYDLSEGQGVVATYQLWDGDTPVAGKTENLLMNPGTIGFVDLDFPLPTVTRDRTLNLQVRVSLRDGKGEFYDDVPVTVYAPTPITLPAGQKLAVFDPKMAEMPSLLAAQVPFQKLAKLGDWNPQTGTLLVGSNGLNSATPQELATLAPKIEAGGRAIVLDHFALPSFLPKSLVQSREADSYVARGVSPSPVTNGLLTEDLRAWTTRERDQVVSWNPLETPSTGAFRVYCTTVGKAPVLEVGDGKGRVLFAQLNFKDALGVEPAARRALADVLNWTATPSPFYAGRTLLLSGDDKINGALKNRIGLDAAESPVPDATLVVASGTSPAVRVNLEAGRARLKTNLENGGTLFLYGMNADGARWLSDFTGSPVQIAPFPHRYAYLTQTDSPLTAGLGHGDFWPNGLGKGLNPNQPLTGEGPTGTYVLSGPNVQNLTRPGYVSVIPVGKGRIVVDLVRSLENPVPSQMRVLSVLLSNAGAHIDPDSGGAEDATRWTFHPLDLTPFVNWSLTDTDDPNGKRGYNGSGADDDLREFPTGRQTLRGVDYFITPPGTASSNSLILLSGKNPKLTSGAAEVRGIPVHRKAERLYFLHNAAWGVPGFTYRVYYEPDHKEWIFGKPDPFVDVTVKPGENITEWVAGGSVERQQTFLGGASVAWLGGNKRTRGNSTTGDKELGVYQMIWDNPHPEKEIESIDILSPGTVGSGNAFVFGITAATRDDSGAATAKPNLSSVLPNNVKASDVLEQVQYPNYGFALLKNGVIASVYDAKGRPFARTAPFKSAASGKNSDGSRQTRTLLDQATATPHVQTSGRDGGRKVWEFSGTGALNWRESVIATPGRLRCELRYTPIKPLPPGFGAKLDAGVNFINGTSAVVRVNENPFLLKTLSGDAIFTFDKRFTRWVFSYQLEMGRVNLSSPPQDGSPWTTGEEQSLFWEITPP